MRPTLLAPLLVTLFACATPEGPAPRPRPPAAQPATSATAAALSVPTPPVAATATPAAPRPALVFSHDDFDAARARARASGKVLLVDAWAPWCHTCLSMQAYVLSDPSLAPLAASVEAVAIDTDREENAAFLERYALQAWPTFFVLDPNDGEVFGYWAGSATLDEMRSFIDEARQAVEAAHAGTRTGPEGELVRAHAAFARKDAKGAAKGYAAAVKGLAPTDPRRSEALLGWLRALYMQKSWAPCAAAAREHIGEVRGGATPADFSYYALSCAGQLPRGEARSATESAAIAKLEALAANPSPGATVDDQADVFSILAEARRDSGDAEGAKKAEETRLALLEAAARAATSKEAAATFDYGRAQAYVALGRGPEAVAMLTAREAEMPDSYEPPARLADVLFALHRNEEALAAVDRAIARAYGPRRLRYVSTRADVLHALGRHADELAALRELVRGYEGLARGHANADKLAAAKKKLAQAEAEKR